MSRRAYPQNPTVPSQSTFPAGGGGYSGQNVYPGPPGGGAQPPIGGGYPRQHYPPQPRYSAPPAPSQGWAPPSATTSSSGYGLQGQTPGHTMNTVHGGFGTSQPTAYRPPPPVGGGMTGPPPPTHPSATAGVAAVSQAPPTSVAAMTTGVGRMQLGPQTAGNLFELQALRLAAN